MAFVLLDTDILINLLRGVEKARLYLQNTAAENMVGCSVITVAEIYAGMQTHEKEKTDLLLDGLEIVEVTRAITEKAGLYKAAAGGRTLELDDCIIAATAFAMRATLATGNGNHYPMDDIRKDLVSFTWLVGLAKGKTRKVPKGEMEDKICEKPYPVIDPLECKGCERCVIACPKEALEVGDEYNERGYRPIVYKGEGCVGCGACYYTCPEPNALEVHIPTKKGKEDD